VTEPVHPSLDELAELHEGVLDAKRQPEVSAHLASCDECTSATAALSEVGTVLTAAGSVPMPIPADRAASLQDALRRVGAEAAAGVSSLDEHRDRPERRRSAASRVRVPRWVSAAGAAAAVVLACYGGISLLDNGGPDHSSSADSGAAGGRAAAGRGDSSGAAPSPSPESFASQMPGKSAGEIQAVTPKTLAAYAAELGSRPASGATKPSCGPAAVDLPHRSRTATIRWKGAPALVVVDLTRHRATVYSCSQAAALFSTGY
jgi:anti-sigma factor RsiW